MRCLALEGGGLLCCVFFSRLFVAAHHLGVRVITVQPGYIQVLLVCFVVSRLSELSGQSDILAKLDPAHLERASRLARSEEGALYPGFGRYLRETFGGAAKPQRGVAPLVSSQAKRERRGEGLLCSFVFFFADDFDGSDCALSGAGNARRRMGGKSCLFCLFFCASSACLLLRRC